jgi:hypothetical protein
MQAEGHIFSLYSGVLARLKNKKRTLLICKLQKSRCFVIVIGVVANISWLSFSWGSNKVLVGKCIQFCISMIMQWKYLVPSQYTVFVIYQYLLFWIGTRIVIFFFLLICNEGFMYDLKEPLLKRVILKVFLIFCS